MTTASEQKLTTDQLDQLCINTIRFLAVDGVQKANSGHPGAPMGMAALAYTLWTRHMRFNPKNPHWINRDRFILSNGHASMLLYSMLYLTGYDLPLDQLKNFRQWGSMTPGHPEYGMAPGVEATTGPLGQGFANGVGMGMAEHFLAATFNKQDQDIIDHYTYVFCGDGDMQEGVASEAASLAGHLKLGKLIYIYDDNKIQLDAPTNLAFTEDVAKRFQAYGWHTIDLPNASTDVEGIDRAIQAAKAVKDRPTLILAHTNIGYGSPNKHDTSKVHGNPLGPDEVKATKQNLGWPVDQDFYVPDEALKVFRDAGEKGAQAEAEWNKKFEAYRQAYGQEAATLTAAFEHKLPEGWNADLPTFSGEDVATRDAGGKVVSALAKKIPTFLGGSADLSESTKAIPEEHKFEAPDSGLGDYSGRHIFFGVREFAMAAAVNGMSYHGGVYAFGSTFLTFSDYMRNAIRLSALAHIPSIFVFTHDSIGLGEDGPTHQPIEHFAALRAIPGLKVFRPGDANETAYSWHTMMQQSGPSVIILTRQKIPVIDQSKYASAENVAKGGYILSEAGNGQKPKLILIATGSEVPLALKAQPELEKAGIPTRVVSMPCTELFDEQSKEYKQQVLPDDVTARLSIEAGVEMGWAKYVGSQGASLSIEHFGASAPAAEIFKHYGFTVEEVTKLGQLLMQSGQVARDEIENLQKEGQFQHGSDTAVGPTKPYEGHS
ncbi:MAG TPA: transketolase [Chloroflexia bacterium]|nr:transketolase [Chloroflexia bacterium]